MNINKLTIVACPQCGSEVIWSSEISPYRPFCSERCKLIDLGQWASESYRVEIAEDVADDLQEPNHQA